MNCLAVPLSVKNCSDWFERLSLAAGGRMGMQARSRSFISGTMALALECSSGSSVPPAPASSADLSVRNKVASRYVTTGDTSPERLCDSSRSTMARMRGTVSTQILTVPEWMRSVATRMATRCTPPGRICGFL